MRILVWGINYTPELTGIAPCNTALCEHLRATGHDVEMITTFPYYPAWQKRAEDRGTFYRTDIMRGVPVHRCWHYVPARVNAWRRILHEASFVLASFARILTLPRADLLIVVSPPLLLGAAAWLTGMRYVFHVQDLQPDAAVGLGMLKRGWFTRLLYGLEALAYRHAWRVSGISSGMVATFATKGVPPEKRLLFPNGIRLDPPPARGSFRQRHGFGPDDFLAIYSGNIGVKQGLDIVVRAAKAVRDASVRVVICGDGADRARIASLAGAAKNIHLLPLLSEPEYREMLADCDVALVTQVAGSGRAFFPSKLLPAFAAARPVVSVADPESELASAIRESGGGVNIPPGDPIALARKLDELARDAAGCARLAQAGREWVQRYELHRVLSAFTSEIEKA